ncbi:putative RNA-directed DNA polymerase from transposon X-element [Trichonephila clavipes]|uniref:Putative RNA-directed DNA polymerase from transposon X-element n=1 Tax=Trichonephila clavipes TaxID=2585209 RepID=A0A8X6SHE6_TRICX|nr:putative RNA-directed DNA polymerase from transposon X-element [Trichonephila clavipes]
MLSQSIKDSLDHRCFVLAVFVDFEDAFDKSPLILVTLPSFKQSEILCYWPSFFPNIFIDDLPGITSDGPTNAALFADDLAIWCCASKEQLELNTVLNKSLERLEVWCLENNMTINLGKTTSQYFILNRQPFTANFAYRDTFLQHNDVSSYLGCIFDNKLKWTKRVEHVILKAWKRFPILKRLAGAK